MFWKKKKYAEFSESQYDEDQCREIQSLDTFKGTQITTINPCIQPQGIVGTIANVIVSRTAIKAQTEFQKTVAECDASVAVAKMRHEEVMDLHKQSDKVIQHVLNSSLANDKETILSMMEMIKSGAGVHNNDRKIINGEAEIIEEQ